MSMPDDDAPYPQRRHVRLRDYDYSQAGGYYVTICTANRRHLFGSITDAAMHPNAVGRVVEEEWLRLAERWKSVEIDAYVVMPNHFHGVLILLDGDKQNAVGRVKRPSLSMLVNQFKSRVTKRVANLGATSTEVWQRGFFDHVIRDERDLLEKRSYIENNPAKWQDDKYYKDQVNGDDG
jgi:putative transposase